MTRPDDDSIVESIRLYREALIQTRELYIESGQSIRGSYGWTATGNDEDAVSIAAQMEELHQGFVMKIYASVVPDTGSQSLEQRQLGRALLEHIWGQAVMGSQLREAVQWLVGAAGDFQWSELVKPFTELPSLRDRWGELETLAVRMANLILSADGKISGGDSQQLRTLTAQFAELQGKLPQEHNEKIATDDARDALDWLRTEAKRLRDGLHTGDQPDSASPSGPSAGSTPSAGPTQRPGSRRPTPTVSGGRPTAGPMKNAPAPQNEDDRTPQQRLADARAKLNRLVGLDGIKDQIQTLSNFLKMESQRQDAGLPTTRPSLHMAFVGNPGTGKTTVARIIAEIYGSLGVLEKGHLVETDRSGLVAEYAGQTGPKTNAKIDEALDGVLFIDEAYTLIDESGQDQYGREAIQTLLKRMEDQRDRLVVILAGYPNEMNKMIRSNPGLSSRVGTTMHFDDYPPEALCRIYELIARKAKYTLPTESRRRLLRGFTYLFISRDRHFGNGRCSRNSFERSVRRLANRLASMDEVNHDLLTTLEPEDIEVAGLTPAHIKAMADEAGQVRVRCSECDAGQVVDDKLLGTEVACESCSETFAADWGEPVMELPKPEVDTGKPEDSSPSSDG